MIARTHRLPVVRQCRLVELSRSTAYYRPREESEENLAVMKEIDRLYMERPTSGSRTIKSLLRMRGIRIARRSRVVRLMRLMGLRAIYPKRRTSSPGEGHKIYPYLLKSMKVTRPREVYAADITYILMAKGFLYLVAVIDWHSRKVLAHRLSNTLDASFCVEAMEEAIACYGSTSGLQHRPGSAVYFGSVHGCAQGARRAHLYGRQRPLARQRVRGAPMAQPQAGRGLPARLRNGGRGQEGDCRLPALLQRRASSPGT